MNVSLLCKWWWKLDKEEEIWQDKIKAKYLKNDMISTIKHRSDDSPVWSDLLKLKHIYLQGRRIKPNDGKKTLLWVDPWLTDEPLYVKYTVLFELCNEKFISLSNFTRKRGQISFRRWLPGILSDQWELLKIISRIISSQAILM